MTIQSDRPDGESESDAVDASINRRLTLHLMDNAIKGDSASGEDVVSMGFLERVVVASGMAFLMSILGFYALIDRRHRFL